MHKLHNEGCLNNYRKDKLLESVTEINSATLVLSAISVETTLLIVHGSVWYAFYNIKVKHALHICRCAWVRAWGYHLRSLFSHGE